MNMRIMENKNKNSSCFGGAICRNTQRRYWLVTGLQRHPTAEQVFLEMKREHPSIALGTVYKHLNGLAEEGLLLRITEPGSPDRYDRTERHDHLICSRCGKIADVHLPDMQSQIERALGREILSYDLKIRYICPDCRGQEENNTEGGDL
jgi:Fe2+ or Zn2+ uptake regulation protein